jgi:hypothetical protein
MEQESADPLANCLCFMNYHKMSYNKRGEIQPLSSTGALDWKLLTPLNCYEQRREENLYAFVFDCRVKII